MKRHEQSEIMWPTVVDCLVDGTMHHWRVMEVTCDKRLNVGQTGSHHAAVIVTVSISWLLVWHSSKCVKIWII